MDILALGFRRSDAEPYSCDVDFGGCSECQFSRRVCVACVAASSKGHNIETCAAVEACPGHVHAIASVVR